MSYEERLAAFRERKRRQWRARFLERLEFPANGCWIWTGSLNESGYGQCYWDFSPRIAHRASYEMFVGEIPVGLQLDHLCCIRACVSPGHLDPCTPYQNYWRSRNRRVPGSNPRVEVPRPRRCRIRFEDLETAEEQGRVA